MLLKSYKSHFKPIFKDVKLSRITYPLQSKRENLQNSLNSIFYEFIFYILSYIYTYACKIFSLLLLVLRLKTRKISNY